MAEETRKIGAELLNDVARKVTALAQEHGLNEDRAKLLGVETAVKLADDWGGQLFYFPKDTKAKIQSRNADIYREFTGDNIADLVAKYGLGVQAVYRIIQSERELRAQKQCKLF